MLKRPHQRPLNKEVQRMEPAPDGLPVCSELARLGFEEQPLERCIELADSLFFVDARIALQALQRRVHGEREGLRQFRLPASRRSLDQNWLLQLAGNENLTDRDIVNDVLGLLELSLEMLNRREHAISP